MSNGDGVTYTVKELIGMLEETLAKNLEAIQVELKEIKAKLDTKASDHRVDALEKLLADAIERIRLIELTNAGSQGMSRGVKWVVGTTVALSSAAMALILYLVSHVGG